MIRLSSSQTFAKLVILFLLGTITDSGIAGAVDDTAEEEQLAPFLKNNSLEIRKLFDTERFPNVVVTKSGSILATFGSTRVMAKISQDGGRTFGKPIEIASPGFQAGGLTVDENTGDILAFAEAKHPPAEIFIYRSTDSGTTWVKQATRIEEDPFGNPPSMHMNEHGITLQHKKYRGRLIRPSRYYAGKNDRSRWPKHYTNAIYSDDGGKSWKTSAPFPAKGTGEACIVELSDGRLYYNSRRHWAPEGDDPRRRWTATSKDGGQTWQNLKFCEALPDGPQDTNYGCMAGLTRLPVANRDILIYSNCDSKKGRTNGTVWASFDGGQTWPVKREITKGPFAYSSLIAGREGTASEGWIYLHFENSPQGGSALARFDLAWLLNGKNTGDGQLPKWIQNSSGLTDRSEIP